MKKTITLLLTLTMLLSLGALAFAATDGSQTITLTVPDNMVITPSIVIEIPTVEKQAGELPVMVNGNAENSSAYKVTGLNITLDDNTFTGGMTYNQGIYTYTFTISKYDGWDQYTLSDEQVTINEKTYTKSDTTFDPFDNITWKRNDDGISVDYVVTYAVAGSWTLNVPADEEILYDQLYHPISLKTSITEVKNMLDTTPIYVFATHTGSFVNTTDNSKTIGFTLTKRPSEEELPANTPNLVNTNVKFDGQDGRNDDSDRVTVGEITLNAEALSAAAPGTYTTTISYSSGLTE